ncbi:hypothetical protein BDV25DRAFT_27857 [Aspergillus avenaceus]|uniref:F-box domain-containing protein n=1 Tax=Aspergillus avenaceus TaxID=36643 RepID=A0A5N6U4A7_ASPAV|nr:hypothetical protein BDV25DRAFT_27857 [Aspergillus avenaceus]
MAEASSAFTTFRITSDFTQFSDDDEFVSSASIASESEPEYPERDMYNTTETAMDLDKVGLDDNNTPVETFADTRPAMGSKEPIPELAENNSTGTGTSVQTTRALNLLDLPMDILQVIIREVTHTNDLTSLALTCSSLHCLAIPQMYSRFDIVWPDTLSSSDHAAGVDALSYGLATLVMGEDIFHELPPTYRSAAPCPNCGCSGVPGEPTAHHQTDTIRKMRRGNYYAQYTRKFSVGNGPLVWVQEYSVTKETGKMLGTLVALAIARMVNLEAFIWDMPTGVLRDVWIALSSLANRPGHDCRLERVWVRWHDNSENAMRTVTTASSLTLPDMHSTFDVLSSTSPPLQRYAHVEYPTLSILPPLKSLSVLDIDEPSYLEETAILIERSRGRLKELRIGISPKVFQADWIKALGGWSPVQQNTPSFAAPGWPKVGGVLGVLLGRSGDSSGSSSARCQRSSSRRRETGHGVQEADGPVFGTGGAVGNAGNGTFGGPLPTFPSNVIPTEQTPKPAPVEGAATLQTELPDQTTGAESPPGAPPNTSKVTETTAFSGTGTRREQLELNVLELERVPLSIPVLLHALDWTRITTLTILRCEGHEKLWRALRRQFAPASRGASRAGTRDSHDVTGASNDYTLKLKRIHTDAVSPYLLLFIKDTIAPNTLETLFLHEAPMYDSIVTVDSIYRNVIRNHRMSLRQILVDSTERSPGGAEVVTSRWRKWMFTREMISFITGGRMPQLRELSMTIHSKDWHYFLQRLPNVPQLRALHIPHIAHPIHRDPKELAMQILDIVTIRPEVGICYIGMQSKCYEILEGKRCDKEDFDDTDDSHSEGFVPGSDDWAASDGNDDSEEDGVGSTIDSNTELSSDDDSSSDGDESDYENARSRPAFRLREILFYDDKITIFKARHGVL